MNGNGIVLLRNALHESKLNFFKWEAHGNSFESKTVSLKRFPIQTLHNFGGLNQHNFTVQKSG